jgi:hypothetical protein
MLRRRRRQPDARRDIAAGIARPRLPSGDQTMELRRDRPCVLAGEKLSARRKDVLLVGAADRDLKHAAVVANKRVGIRLQKKSMSKAHEVRRTADCDGR